ncbi:FCD domain-containing protein [Bacillus licheniformis]|nr:FCD domain-containing protein [Bacillus licheniformis]
MGKQGVFKPGLEGVIAGETNISFLDTEAEQIVIKGYDLNQLESRIERYRRISGYKNPDYKPSVSFNEHLDIFNAVKEKNSVLAEAAMRSHIKRSLRSIEETLERQALEGLLTAEAAQLVTPESLHQLEDRIELMKLAAVKGRKTDTVKYGSEFHSILHAISTNATAKRFLLIELEYPPSEQLAEDSLAKGLNISRTPLRQALYRLELEGLVSKQPNGRLRVCPISLAEAKEVFKVR